jgi:hypothetical protein|tara:strand:- start:463 stop:1374 length:912 start_codon:yes stop_codon:yes gene_type:complete
MRRITTGVQGGPVLGTFTAKVNNLSTIETNVDMVLDPNGTGEVKSAKHIQLNAEKTLKFADADSSNYAGIKSPATVAASYTLTMPGAVPASNGQALVGQTDGTLSFANLGVTTSNQTGDSGTYYLAIMDDADANDGAVTGLNYSAGKLTFVPSTGMLSATAITTTANSSLGGTTTVGTIDCNAGNIDGTTIGGSSRANGSFSTMTATSIVEDSSIAFKENVNPITNALESILQLSGVTYDRKDGSTKNEAGLIAEHVYNILPNLVQLDDAGKPLGISYTKLSAYLIESVKTLTHEIAELKKNK